MDVKIEPSWKEILQPEFEKEYFKQLTEFVKSEYQTKTIYPAQKDIFKKINANIGSPIPEQGDLTHWAKQGVFLLNASLTVQAHEAGTHKKKGWKTFTHEVIRMLAAQKENLVFKLWGAFAQKNAELTDRSKHLVLESVHPSPLSASRGFFGNHHFRKQIPT